MPFILITAATTSQAHKIKSDIHSDNVILGDYMDLPDFMLKPGKLMHIPNPASASYSHEMLTFCLDNDITAVYPLREAEEALLLEAVQLFTEFNINIVKTNEIQ
ncbi:MAG: hypothetical protein ABIN95_10665 [Mucilaginibacter sp.]